MEIKRGATILLVLGLIILNSYLFMEQNNSILSGFAISDVVSENLPTSTSNINFSTIFFILQWIILISIGTIIYLRAMKKKKKEKEKINVSKIKHPTSRSQTDLDTLYNLLIEKKNLSIGTIGTIFGIKKDVALDWAKILEENNLATIDYPAFNDPEVIIKGSEEEENKDDRSVADFFSVQQEGEMNKGKEDKKETVETEIKKEKKGFFGLFKRKIKKDENSKEEGEKPEEEKGTKKVDKKEDKKEKRKGIFRSFAKKKKESL